MRTLTQADHTADQARRKETFDALVALINNPNSAIINVMGEEGCPPCGAVSDPCIGCPRASDDEFNLKALAIAINAYYGEE